MRARGLEVVADGGHLEGPARDQHGDGAVGDAGRDRAQPGGFRAGDHHVGDGGRRDVVIGMRTAHQGVAHGAADDAGLLSATVQQAEHARQSGVGKQGAGGVHRIRPGTIRPSSTWAGR